MESFKNFDYTYYENKLRNFYVGVLNRICHKRHLLLKDDETLGDKQKFIGLEQLKSVIDFILDNNLEEVFELNGEVVSIYHVNDVIRTQAQDIKKQLEKDIVVISEIDDYRKYEYSVGEQAYEKRQKYWGAFSDSKLENKMEEDFKKAKRFFEEETPWQYGPTFWAPGYFHAKCEHNEIMIDGIPKTVINEYKFSAMYNTAKYNYYANKIIDSNRRGK